QAVKVILDRVGAFVVAQQNRRLAVVHYKRLLAGKIFLAASIKALDGAPVMAALYPLVVGAKLELCNRGISLDGFNGAYDVVEIKSIDADGFCCCCHCV